MSQIVTSFFTSKSLLLSSAHRLDHHGRYDRDESGYAVSATVTAIAAVNDWDCHKEVPKEQSFTERLRVALNDPVQSMGRLLQLCACLHLSEWRKVQLS